MNIEQAFEKYVKVQKSGEFNMIMDAPKVMEITGITKEQYIYILQNYRQLLNKYGQA